MKKIAKPLHHKFEKKSAKHVSNAMNVVKTVKMKPITLDNVLRNCSADYPDAAERQS